MRNFLLILRREYLVRVRTKAFLLFTVLIPLFIGGSMILPGKLMTSNEGTHHIAIASADQALAESARGELANADSEDEDQPSQKRPLPGLSFDVELAGQPSEELREQLIGRVRSGQLDGFVWIDGDAAKTRKALFYSRKASDFVEGNAVSRALRVALSEEQLSSHGLSSSDARALMGPVHVDTVQIAKQGTAMSNGVGAFLLPFMLLMAIYMTVFMYGIQVMRSVIEEKSSRVLEVLLGSVSPMELMAGKVIGVGAVGLTQVAIWATCGTVLGTGSFAIAKEAMGDAMKGAHVAPATMALFPVFFVLGYLTYACLYAAIGAMVNSDEEAQQLQFPVTLPLILCMMFATAIIRDPNTPLAFWLSMFPLTSPIIMFVRVSQSMPPWWQIALSISLSLFSLYGLVWVTSRIYRVGILMYGKRPTLPEIVKWIKYA